MSIHKITTPPVIRVFLSSTFADMEYERSYFNEVLTPKLSRICADRGVSFFNVDLRWGITEEDQIGGQVLPICLGEIDKCRPYFIGIIGNRYGSVMEKVPEHVSDSIPWLAGKEGVSITELEMLYAVLDREKDDPAINSAFYIRSERLSRELYPELISESSDALGKLEKLKGVIRADESVLCSDYDTVEEFGEKVMRDLVRWLDENFPESGDVGEIRREWYNGEILRGHIENSEMNSFLDSYIASSRRSLLIYGDGARGKTACLTAWEPADAKKIVINCASDESYTDWTAIALRILKEICAFLSDEDAKELREILDGVNNDCNGYVLGEKEREVFRGAERSCLRALDPECKVAIVINDLNLLSDDVGRLLSWLPSEGEDLINFICSTNDSEMVEIADVIGWNTKEMPLFSCQRASDLINNSLRTYGKNLSPRQFDLLLSSKVSSYPGQLRFVISFLLNHGRFNNLDRLTEDISSIENVHGIYRYVYDFLTSELSEREQSAIREIFGLLRASKVALSESACFELAQNVSEVKRIDWASACRIFEQFDLIHGDYWYIRDEETEKFVDELISADGMSAVHERLAAYLYDCVVDAFKNKNANRREINAYAKQVIESLRAAKNYGNLKHVLGDARIIVSMMNYEPSVLNSSWLELFLETDIDISAELIALASRMNEISRDVAIDVCKMIYALDMRDAHREACENIGVECDEAFPEALWVMKFSDSGVKAYGVLKKLQDERRYRELCEIAGKLLTENANAFNDSEICKIYFFKCDAEQRLGSYEDSLATANEYYKLSLKEGSVEDIRDALSLRASAIYRLGRVNEALSIVRKTGRMAYRAGKIHDYLSTLNMRAMSYYRKSRFEESIEIFDKLIVYWEKIGNKLEVCSTVLNKANALFLSERTEDALELAESFFDSIKGEKSLLSRLPSFCGNIGLYASNLGQYDKAEKYLIDAIEISKMIGAEATLANSYDTLGDLYKKTDSLKKGTKLYAEQMEFHWKRREYAKVMEVYNKSFAWLSASNHKKQALALEAEWKARFSEIEGGDEYFSHVSDKRAADAVNTEDLLERAKLAASSGDRRGEAEAYKLLAAECEKEDPKLAAEYLIKAAMNYMTLEDDESRISVLEWAFKMLFRNGQIVDMIMLDTVVAVAGDEAFDAIAGIWRRLGDLAYIDRLEEEGKRSKDGESDEDVNSAVGELICQIEKNEYLVICCIFDLAEYLVKALSADAILSLISYISEKYREDIIDKFDSAMSNNMNVDMNYLMKNYFGSEADRRIARYEKYVRVLDELEGVNAPAISGNLALIFRRRKEKEKVFYYHKLSAEIFRKAKKMDDYFIEIMNIATAYKELSTVTEAIDTLRGGMKEALETSNRRFAAMIAGNLASMLMVEMNEEDFGEIESCFEIEESYFRESGYWRDLTISLVNQSIFYINTDSPISRWKHKVEEAREIIDEVKLDEFEDTVSKLEWRIAAAESKNGLSDEFVREKITSLLEGSEYSVHSFEREDRYYYIIATPKNDDNFYREVLQAALPYDKNCCLRILATIQPALYKGESENLEKYFEWWNQFNKYTLEWKKEDKRIMADITLYASDWDQLAVYFKQFIAMWEIDKMNVVSLMLDVVDLDACRQVKLKAM